MHTLSASSSAVEGVRQLAPVYAGLCKTAHWTIFDRICAYLLLS
jgi:hypothetical protein